MITVKPAEPGDVEAIVRLAEERDRFYAETEIEPPEVRIEQVGEALFGATPYAMTIPARDDGDLIGFASRERRRQTAHAARIRDRDPPRLQPS